MDFKQLENANRTIKTTDIKGKDYAEVNQRIRVFRMLFPNGSIETELLSDENGICKFKAFVYDENGKLLGTGHAYEKEASSFINKTSYIENCETSAVGRALGMLGIGIDVSLASYEEVANAIKNQNEDKKDTTKKVEKKQTEKKQPEKKEAESNTVDQEELKRKLTQKEVEETKVLLTSNGIELVEVANAFGVSRFEDLTLLNRYQIIKNIEVLKTKFPIKEGVKKE